MIGWTIDEAQALTDCVALIIDPKHKYQIKKYRKTCAFIGETFFFHHRKRLIGLTSATLANNNQNGLLKILVHEIAHFVHAQRYRKRLDLLRKQRCHRATFRMKIMLHFRPFISVPFVFGIINKTNGNQKVFVPQHL